MAGPLDSHESLKAVCFVAQISKNNYNTPVEHTRKWQSPYIAHYERNPFIY